jgi:hypothetical protein
MCVHTKTHTITAVQCSYLKRSLKTSCLIKNYFVDTLEGGINGKAYVCVFLFGILQ